MNRLSSTRNRGFVTDSEQARTSRCQIADAFTEPEIEFWPYTGNPEVSRSRVENENSHPVG
jgi:hypothetical protein